jgi:hypothetical protein
MARAWPEVRAAQLEALEELEFGATQQEAGGAQQLEVKEADDQPQASYNLVDF